jgi:uncharacterized protein
MKKIVIALVILALAAPAFAVSPNVRIAQVYGGGGSSSATTYKQDYVVLFNASGTDVNISGWAIEYGSATGNWGSSSGNMFVFPADTWIAGCSYIFVGCGTVGTGGADFPITPDYIQTSGPNISATTGKVGLFNLVNSNLACNSELAGTLVDKVSFGTGNCPEGTNVAALSITTGAVRNGGGTIDTDSNVADFTVVTAPVPMNRASGAWQCAPVATENQTFGTLKAIFR